MTVSSENAVLARDVGKTIKWQGQETGKLDVNVGDTLTVSPTGEINVDLTALPKVAEKDARTGDVTITNPDGSEVVLEVPRVRIGPNDNWFIDGVDTNRSSRGAKGDKGEQGNTGRQGVQGNSAYEVARANGFAGTEVQWLASLKGEKGEQGQAGAKGDKGDPLRFTDLTPEQKRELKGEKGDPVKVDNRTIQFNRNGELESMQIRTYHTYTINLNTLEVEHPEKTKEIREIGGIAEIQVSFLNSEAYRTAFDNAGLTTEFFQQQGLNRDIYTAALVRIYNPYKSGIFEDDTMGEQEVILMDRNSRTVGVPFVKFRRKIVSNRRKRGNETQNNGVLDNAGVLTKDNWTAWVIDTNLTPADTSPKQDKHLKNIVRTQDNKVRFIVGVEGNDATDVSYDVELPTLSTPPESLFVDVRLGVSTNKHQVNEGGTANIIYTITNTGSAAAASITLDITNAVPDGKRVSYAEPIITKSKAGNVAKVSGTKFTIDNLDSGGAVAITIPTTYQDFGSVTHSGVVTVSSNNVDKSADDNRASAKVDITTSRDTSYQPTQDCPALQVIDRGTRKSLLLMDYGNAMYLTNRSMFVQEPPAQPATMNRLNVYSPTTTSIELEIQNAGTVVVHGFNPTPSADGLQATLRQPTDGTYYWLNVNERSTGYDFNGKRYVVKPELLIGTKTGSSAEGITTFVTSPILRDKLTIQNSTKPAGVTESFTNGVLRIDGLQAGTWLNVLFKPTGSNCQWQSVLIAIPREITSNIPAGSKLSVVSGQSSQVSIQSGLSNRADVVTGYQNINGDISLDTPIVALDTPSSDKAVINAPAGVRNEYVLSVTGSKLDPRNTTQGNVKIIPNSEGTQLTVTIESTATSSDNFVYVNNGVKVEIKVA